MLTEFPATTTMTVEQALNRALRDNLQDVLICGYDSDGDLIVRSSRMNRADANFLLDRAKMHALVEDSE
jgi:hypothetical protein